MLLNWWILSISHLSLSHLFSTSYFVMCCCGCIVKLSLNLLGINVKPGDLSDDSVV